MEMCAFLVHGMIRYEALECLDLRGDAALLLGDVERGEDARSRPQGRLARTPRCFAWIFCRSVSANAGHISALTNPVLFLHSGVLGKASQESESYWVMVMGEGESSAVNAQ